MRWVRGGLAGGALATVLALDAAAYIERLYPLKDVIRESAVIAEGVVEKFDARRKTCAVRITGSLKGKCGYEQIRINLGAGQDWHPAAIQKHLVPQTPVLVFYSADHKGIAYVNHFFFQIYGNAHEPPERAWWTLTHIEVFMNRTFDGAAPELIRVVKETLAGKPAPAANPRKKKLNRAMIDALPAPGPDGKVGPGFESVVPASQLEKQKYLPDEEGFLNAWLLLGPIPLAPEDLATEEAQNAALGRFPPGAENPAPGQRLRIGERVRAWQPVESHDYFADLSGFAAQSGRPAENSLFLGTTYVFARREIEGVRLAIGSDDSSRWWLNGKEVISVVTGRGVEKDQNTSEPLTLKKGLNVLRFSVLNGGGPAGGCARFLQKNGKPLTDLLHDSIPKEPPEEY
jgi:hypothetical protein